MGRAPDDDAVQFHFIVGHGADLNQFGFDGLGVSHEPSASHGTPQSSLKLTSMTACTATGSPLSVPGSKCHFSTASAALRSRPGSRLWLTLMSWARPSVPTTTESLTVPAILALRASSVYTGSTL